MANVDEYLSMISRGEEDPSLMLEFDPDTGRLRVKRIERQYADELQSMINRSQEDPSCKVTFDPDTGKLRVVSIERTDVVRGKTMQILASKLH